MIADDTDRSILFLDTLCVHRTNQIGNLVFPFYTIPEDGSDY